MAKNKILEAPFDHPNLTPMISKKDQEEIAKRVVEDYDRDLRSRTDWDKKRKNWLKLYMGHVDPKTYPWPNCSNVPIPLLTIAVIQFQARAYEAMMPARDKIKVAYTGIEDQLRAERVEKFMNYQVNHEMEDFEEEWDVSLFQLPINGSIFRKTYYDPIKGHNVSEYCSVDEIIIPYHTHPTKNPNRITHILYLTKNDLAIRELAGVFVNTEDLKEGSPAEITQSKTEVKDTSDIMSGIIPSSETTSDTPRVVLEQHRLWDLDDDGIEEPYIFTVDKTDRKLLRTVKRLFIDNEGNPREVEYFTHYYFFPNPEGFYGNGFGHILEGINEAAKSILNQIIDAGTLANLSGKSGFFNKRSGIKKGDLEFALGKFKGVDIPSDDIRKALYAFEFPGPSNVLFSVLGLLQDYSTRVTTVSETMTGELPRSDTPATAIVSAIEQGMKVFSTIHKRIHRRFKKELKKLYLLNAIYGDQMKYERVLGDLYVAQQKQQGVDINIAMDHMGDLDIQPVSDPHIISRAEKMAIAEQVLAKTMTNPLSAQNPQAIYEAHKRFYKALGVEDFDVLLPPPPEPPDLNPVEENAMMIKEQGVAALPQQDHLKHIEVHDAFMETIYVNELSPNGKNLMEAHRREHVALQYSKEQGGQGGQQQQVL